MVNYMLKSNSRIELLDGIRFYEQDVLYDDYIFTGSFKIELDIFTKKDINFMLLYKNVT